MALDNADKYAEIMRALKAPYVKSRAYKLFGPCKPKDTDDNVVRENLPINERYYDEYASFDENGNVVNV